MNTPTGVGRTELCTATKQIVQSEVVSEITQDDVMAAVREAIRDTYSTDRPHRVVVDVAGTGAIAYSIDDSLTEYVDGFSIIESIEYPVDDDSPEIDLIDGNEWDIHRRPIGLFIVFEQDRPRTNETFRITYTTYHKETNMRFASIPARDIDPIANLSASFVMEQLALKVSTEVDPSVDADSFDRSSRFRRYTDRAKYYREKYRMSIGKPDDSSQVAAGAVADWDTTLRGDIEHLTHHSRYR